MAFVVTEACIRCRYTDCVEVCPVDCFHAGANMLVIDPDVCIDCALCEPECPVVAIKPETDDGMSAWVDMNRQYAGQWPVIIDKEAAPADADEWQDVTDKFAQHFDPSPAKA